GGTIGYLVNSAGAMAIDSQFANTAAIAVAGLEQRAPQGIEMLLNTHHHGDHTGGNLVFRGAVKRIVGHVNCLASHKKMAAEAKSESQTSFADTTFTDQWKASFGDETIQARYYGAGHTSGDAVYHFERANVVHMGDLLFNHAHPNIDRAAGASTASWISALEKVSKTHSNDTIFIAGHAKDDNVRCVKADLMRFRDYLSLCMDTAQKAIAAGQSKEELQKMSVLPGFEDNASPNPRLTLGFVLGLCYDELSESK
ncbi:MAG TPA: MBL fold metallo-hydrolase, partial [Vicinamibacterales bacterium]|nr:MBL fold metallo-hydrolase [Vicinamibacterales bacterium]